MAASLESQPIAPASQPRQSRPIDLIHLAKQTLGDPGLEIEVLRMFDQIAEVHFARLEQSTSISDLLTHLHTLKAASVGVGAWSLAEHAHIMASELKAGEPVKPERIDDIHFALEEVRAFIATAIARADAELA